MNTDMSRRQFVGLAGSLATVLGLGLVGCGGGAVKGSAAGSAAAKDVKGAAESKKLVVGFDKSYPPYGFVGDDGEYTALISIWPRLLPISRAGRSNTRPSTGTPRIRCLTRAHQLHLERLYHEGREDDYTFSEPYMLNEQVLVVKKDAGIKGWDDLAGKTVITQTDSAAQDVLEGDQKDLAATFATLDTIGEYNTAFMQLESGAVDAVACDLSIAQYQLAAKPDAYTQLDEPLSSEHYAVGFKKGDTKSADAVAESLKALYEDGTVKDLCDKYSSYGLSFDNWVLK